MIIHNNTIHTSINNQTNGQPDVSTINDDMAKINNVQKCLNSTNAALPRKIFNDLTNQSSDNSEHFKSNQPRIRPSNRGAMSELNSELNISPSPHNTPTRNAPSNGGFQYRPSYVPVVNLTNSSYNRSAPSFNPPENSDDNSNAAGKSKRPRKARSIFSAEQLKMLNDEFERHNYINNYTREELANRVGITSEQVKIWFQNMRSKRRKSHERISLQHQMGFDYSAMQQLGHLTSNLNRQNQISINYIPPGHQMPQHHFSNQNVTSMIPQHHSGSSNYSGSSNNSSGGASSYAYVSPASNNSGARNSNAQNNPLNVNMVGNQNTQHPSLFWDSSNKNNMNRNNNLPAFDSNSNHQAYSSQQQSNNYPIKDSCDSGSTSGQMQIVQSNSNKTATFIAPGFASTLYNAKLNSESKNVVDCEDTKPSSYVPNRSSNIIPTTHDNSQKNHKYTTSTPLNRNNYYSSSSTSFATNGNPKVYSTTQQPPHNANGRTNH